MGESSIMTRQSEFVFPKGVTSCSPTTEDSEICRSSGSKLQVLLLDPLGDQQAVQADQREQTLLGTNAKPADIGMKDGARTQPQHVPGSMHAPSVVPMPTHHPSAGNQRWLERWVTRPHYVRRLVWKDGEDVQVPSATATEYADLVPSPPPNELCDEPALGTIASRPDLFKIVTPINVDIFESYLSTHTNPSFVRSVCRGLCEGFWPWADMRDQSLPTTWDNSHRLLHDPAHIDFVRSQ
jgi:hypothetical protein